ncbi:heme exporter protein CcmD [Aquabacterium olei]|uniref:Heme exporter protein D n=1 Tax=Aquabacterium olei TaxID=1296669 RepID=A0A2U8FWD2_9BURK|nr:heme exporter protein CcmD [Aquabacterium olei]AWI54526.1 heme exporter protein CcmD [Aquabacterium olei]
MNWTSWNAFIDMGGYGRYVWGSFGAVALALGIEAVLLRHADRRLRNAVRASWQDEAAEGPAHVESAP